MQTANLITCIEAYKALQTLSEQPLDITSAYAIMQLKRELTPHVEFFTDKEMEIMWKYAKQNENGEPITDGARFAIDNDKYEAFTKEKAELCGLEIEYTPRELKKAPEKITASALEALDGFLTIPMEDTADGG